MNLNKLKIFTRLFVLVGSLSLLLIAMRMGEAVMVTGSHLPTDFFTSMEQRLDGYCIKQVMQDIMHNTLIGAGQRRGLA